MKDEKIPQKKFLIFKIVSSTVEFKGIMSRVPTTVDSRKDFSAIEVDNTNPVYLVSAVFTVDKETRLYAKGFGHKEEAEYNKKYLLPQLHQNYMAAGTQFDYCIVA